MNPPEWKAKEMQRVCTQDSNRDGVVNSLDANFNQLRVWRDLNQDGISQAGELQTLSQAGIACIGVTGTATNTNLGNGNTQVASGSFTRTNGSTGVTATAVRSLLGV
jgi:transposase-like protein